MESLYLWVPVVFVLTSVALVVYLWAVKSGQYDDLDREGQQLLFDEEKRIPPSLVGTPTEQGKPDKEND